MNALVYKPVATTSPTIIKLFTFVENRRFEKAESLLISLVEDIMGKNSPSAEEIQADLALISTIYHDFNHAYMQHIQHVGKDEFAEIDSLMNSEHHNFLFANLTDPASMDDLLYEVKEYLTDLQDESHGEEAQLQLAYYKKLVE